MKPYINLMALDPGGTTGVAIRSEKGSILTWACKEPHELFKVIFETRALNQIVIENFNAQLINKYGIYTVRIVGAIEALAYVLEIPYHVHLPQQRYPFQKQAKELLKGRNTVIHEQDALAHLLRWEHDNKIGAA